MLGPCVAVMVGVMQVSEEIIKTRDALAQAGSRRSNALSEEQQQRSLLEALNRTLKRKRSQISDLKFAQSLSLED
jgi:hypothetical protein